MPLSCSYKITGGNIVGFPSPPINPPDPTPEGPGVSPIPDDVYEATPFSFDLVYQCYEISAETETLINTTIDLVSFTSSISGIQCVKINSTTLRIYGSASNVFTDAYYTFLMKDGTIKNLQANTTEDYQSLIEWSIPSTKIAPINYTIVAKVTNLVDNTFEDKTNAYTHDVYWKLEPALAQFRDILARESA